MNQSKDDEEFELTRVSGKFEAEPIVAALRANGIPARTRGEAAGELYGLTLDGMGEVTILVPSRYAAPARKLLDAANRGELRLPDETADDKS